MRYSISYKIESLGNVKEFSNLFDVRKELNLKLSLDSLRSRLSPSFNFVKDNIDYKITVIQTPVTEGLRQW